MQSKDIKMRKNSIKTKIIPTDKRRENKRIKPGAPKFIGGKRPSATDVKKDAYGLIGDASKKISGLTGGLSKIFNDTIHNKSFPTKQDKIYNKKKKLDEYRNSDFYKKLMDLENK